MKQINKKLLELNKELAHGAKKEIAIRSGVNPHTVYRFFKGHPVRPSTSSRIIQAVKAIKKEEIKLLSTL